MCFYSEKKLIRSSVALLVSGCILLASPYATISFADGSNQIAPEQFDLQVPVNPNTENSSEEPLSEEKQCSCGAQNGMPHDSSCPLYEQSNQTDSSEDNLCNCGAKDGSAHAENCPLYSVPSAESLPKKDVIEIDGLSCEFKFDHQNKTACWTGVKNPPESQVAFSLPSSVSYHDAEYTVTETSLSFWSPIKCISEISLPNTLTDMNGNFTLPNIKSLTIPGSITTFSTSLQGCSSLETLTFEEGVEEIASNSMVSNCNNLTTISLPSSLKVISESSTFSDTSALTSVNLPDGVQILEGGLFSDCTSLQSVTLPASISKIPYNTFKGCTSLQEVIVNNTITSVGNSAFYGTTNLTNIFDLSQVTELGDSCFYESGIGGAVDLSLIDVIPYGAFYRTNINSVTFSNSLTEIQNKAFGNTKLTEVTFPDTLQSIGNQAFCWCPLEGTLIIPDNVTKIDEYAFNGCEAETVKIGKGITELNTNVFADCGSLKEVIFNNSQDTVKLIGDFPDTVTVKYTLPSISDDTGAAIRPDGPSFQDAVNASQPGDTIKIEKDIKLSSPVIVPSGKNVTVSSDKAFTILGVTSKINTLFQIEEGASLTLSGNLTLSGIFNTGSVISNYGTLTIEDNISVQDSTLSQDNTAVIDVKGNTAKLFLHGGTLQNNSVNSSYSGTVRVSGGAFMEMSGGIIENNAVSLGNKDIESCSSSGILLLCDNQSASLSISGGTIRNNLATRGSAVMMFSRDSYNPDTRLSFQLSGGTITQNTCRSASGSPIASASGAVHLEGNSEFYMTGGTISGNKGRSGAGVCVADIHSNPGKTSFTMDAGTISDNKGVSGGGIYSFSDYVQLNGGKIINNTAEQGGGIYSEGNYQDYTSLHLSNVLITDNTAEQGGGIWLCPTGASSIYSHNGAAVFDNSATGAGDDFASPQNQNDKTKTLDTRLLGGGDISWHRDGMGLSAYFQRPFKHCC